MSRFELGLVVAIALTFCASLYAVYYRAAYMDCVEIEPARHGWVGGKYLYIAPVERCVPRAP